MTTLLTPRSTERLSLPTDPLDASDSAANDGDDAWNSRQRLEFLEGQRLILEGMARDASLNETLEQIVLLIESQAPGMRCSILLRDGQALYHGAAPSLPGEYNEEVSGILIGEGQGSCGTAAFRCEMIVASNLATEPNWEKFRDLAARFNLAACWSAPILCPSDTVLGTFACYYHEPRNPSQADIRLIKEATSLAGIAIGKERRSRELQESAERFRLVAHVTNNALWFANLETGSLYWSGEFASVFGHSQADLEATTTAWMSYIHDEDRDRVLTSINAAMNSGAGRWEAQYRFRRGDGSFATVLDQAHILRDADGHPKQMLGGMTDLSDRLKAEEEIATQAALLDHASDAIIVRSLDHRITYWNCGAERIYGWPRAEALQLSAEHYQKDSKRFRSATQAVLEKGSWMGELDQTTKDGRTLHLQCRWTLLRDRAGNPASILAINTDITEKKIIEAQFLRAQRMESIGTLAGGIAHDLNNVLTPILMGMDLLKMKTADPGALGVISMIEDSARRGAEMIGQLLSFARGLDGQRHVIQPVEIIQEVTRILKDTLPRNITLNIQGTECKASILGDATQLHQVIINLCVNARDAMPSGGELTISVGESKTAAPGQLEPAEGKWVCISITDTGTGISSSDLERIFEPFFTTKEVGKGTGLGLATVQAIIRSHGGNVEVSSEPGTGTTFKIWLPVTQSANAAPDNETADPELALPRGNGETILVVDDENSVRSLTRQTLQAFGYQVLTATDGADAIRVYSQNAGEIAVVLTDMMMPVMDGPTAVLALRAINPDIKVIAATGMAQDDKLTLMQTAGVTHFLPKPYPAAALLKLLRELIRATR